MTEWLRLHPISITQLIYNDINHTILMLVRIFGCRKKN